jgi:ribosomal protein S12 methylthiotransferase
MKSARPKARVFFRSLGCPKNQVDSEVMLAKLALGDYVIAQEIGDADVAVINTCSFVEDARRESIEAILELADLRERGSLRALVVTGCLPQRYGTALATELPEVDAFVGTNRFPGIVTVIDEVLEGRSQRVCVDAGRTYLYDETDPRLLIGSHHSAYIKVAEGCDRACSFCAIPAIRGPFQSRSQESILREARALADGGVREVNLISQDTTSYGKDRHGRPHLVALLRELDQIASLDWIRLLYLYPSAVSDALIDAIAEARRVLPYLDIPLQHASDPVLRAMKRGITADRQRRLIQTLRARIPDVVLRSTVMVGFPGETEADFSELVDFVRESRFDRLGVFRYSDEENTPAAGMSGKVPPEAVADRYRRLTRLQYTIMRETLAEMVGSEQRVLVDTGATDLSADVAFGRLWSQAPEVDGGVWLKGPARAGDFVKVRVLGLRDVDLEGEVIP